MLTPTNFCSWRRWIWVECLGEGDNGVVEEALQNIQSKKYKFIVIHLLLYLIARSLSIICPASAQHIYLLFLFLLLLQCPSITSHDMSISQEKRKTKLTIRTHSFPQLQGNSLNIQILPITRLHLHRIRPNDLLNLSRLERHFGLAHDFCIRAFCFAISSCNGNEVVMGPYQPKPQKQISPARYTHHSLVSSARRRTLLHHLLVFLSFRRCRRCRCLPA